MEEKKNVQNNNVKEKKEKREKNVKTKKSKKKIIIAVIIVVVILALIAAFILYHYSQLRTLTDEINKVSSIEFVNEDGSIKQDASIDMNIKTKGKYAIVEKTLKDYMNDTIKVAKESEDVEQAINDLMLISSIDKIAYDAPDFTETKQKISDAKQKILDYFNKLKEKSNKENLLNAINDKDVGNYYKELYKTLALDEESEQSLDSALTELESQEGAIESVFDYFSNMINFLSDNKNVWKIEDGQLLFYDQEKLNEYNSLILNMPQID